MEPTLETFWKAHRRQFANMLRARGCSREDTEDIIGEGFIRLMPVWHTLDKGEQKKVNYSMTVLCRLHLDSKRRARRRVFELPLQTLFVQSGGEDAMSTDEYDRTPDPAALASFNDNINEEYGEALANQITGMLKDHQRESFMRNFDKFYRDNEEVEINGTDRSRLFRVRANLRKNGITETDLVMA